MRIQLLHEIIEELKEKLDLENAAYNDLLSLENSEKEVIAHSLKIEKIQNDLTIFQQEHDELLQRELKMLSSRSIAH